MKAPARCIVTAVALAALSVLAIGSAQAHPAEHERGGQPLSGPAEQTHARQTLQRTRAREHHAYPAATDPQAQAARRALQRTLAREHHAYPTPTDPQQHADSSRAPIILAVTGAVGLSVMVAAAAARWRRRARSRPREAI